MSCKIHAQLTYLKQTAFILAKSVIFNHFCEMRGDDRVNKMRKYLQSIYNLLNQNF